MALSLTMPKLGLTMNSGSVQEWKKKVGDTVAKGEILFVVATDKLTVDVESPADGVLLAVTVENGLDVPVGTPIGVIGERGEAMEGAAPALAPSAAGGAGTPAAAPATRVSIPASPASAGPAERPAGGHIAASPKAKKIAREKGIALSTLTGTGPAGWIVARDVMAAPQVKASPVAARMAHDAGVDLAALAATGGRRIMKDDVAAFVGNAASSDALSAASAAPLVLEDRRIPVTPMRRIIGERMLQSVTTAPAVSYFVDADMTALNELRSGCNKRLAKENLALTISVNDILMALCAKLLPESPMLNASVEPDAFVLHAAVNIGFAVALPGGLLVPNIKNVRAKSLTRIAQERAALVERARGGTLALEEMTGGTFTLSNLGMMGIAAFTPIINPPEAAILGIGTTREAPVVCEGAVIVRPVATLCLTADHRLADGADAAIFLARLKDLVENPGLSLL